MPLGDKAIMLLLRVDCLSKEIARAIAVKDEAATARLTAEMKAATDEAIKIIERMRVL